MGLSQFLILRRLFCQTPRFHRTLFINHLTVRPFSSSPTTGENSKPTSLSSRMSFIFDQIDSIEKERNQKDETLQRIRAWRESKKEKQPTSENEENVNGADKVAVLEPVDEKKKGLMNAGVELVHPWPEWIELMERLVQQNYFDCRRKDEDKLISESGLDAGAGAGAGSGPSIMEEVVDEGFDFTRDWKTVQRACINFGKDRFDILRSLSRQDIQILVGFGCPTADKKVVFSAKLLRKLVHLDEGDVCSSCSLRNSCERAYLLTQKEEEARTIDIMRVLLTYGFDPINGSVVNDSLLKKKSVKTVIRKLLHEVVKLSAVPIDPSLPPPIIRTPPPKVKQAPPPPKKRVGRDDIEMKRGDWLCPKCNFMNFAKNTVCLQCDAKRPKRQLLPGEWECPECNFLNYRRNMACFHCECKRPPDGFTENQMQDRQRGPRTRLDNISRKEVSDAWNFDFDDNESDGADVAAFEYADSKKLDEDFPASRHMDEESMTGFEKESFERRKSVRPQERDYSALGPKRPGVGFDDFDDEEEDDIDSYELDTKQNGSQLPNSSSVNFSDIDIDSSGDDEATNDNWRTRQMVSSSTRNKKASKSLRRKPVFSGSEDEGIDFNSDEDLPVHPNWKSSHVANSGQRSSRRMAANFGSDEASDFGSGAEDFSGDDTPPRRNKVNGRGSSSPTDYGRRGGNHKFKDDLSDEDRRFSRDRLRGNTANPGGRRKSAKGFDFSEGSGPRSWGKRRNHADDRGFHGDDYGGSRRNSNEGRSRNLKSHRQENFSNKQNGRFNKSRDSSGADSYVDDERYSRPRINVR